MGASVARDGVECFIPGASIPFLFFSLLNFSFLLVSFFGVDALRSVIAQFDRYFQTWIRELCGVKNGLDEKIDEDVLRWFGHVDRVERVYVGECAGTRSVGRPRKRSIDTVKECLKKRSLAVRQAKRMVQDRSECQGLVKGSAWG